ncbi:acyltransferase [Ensifer sp. SL37]|uniref:acyltransferase n=1 Tax=Ensifer sp. SL37 TaxID=2995137 RepID=UPI0022756E30|nr:acyltransferase [Ensifer sp. SL37]MCY1740693.1 acyltransferase [Ensifer sp. SL37]
MTTAFAVARSAWAPNIKDSCANFGFAVSLVAGFAFAGETAIGLLNAGMPSECAEFASNVTQSEGSFNSISPVVNGIQCYGAFQFCDGTIEDYWNGSKQDFLANPTAQVAAWRQYEQRQWSAAENNGLTSAIGQEVCYKGTCAIITQSSILKACQFGCGKGGKLDNLVKAGLDCSAPGTSDGAGTSVCRYLVSGAGYNVGCITNSNDGIDCLPAVGTTTTKQ